VEDAEVIELLLFRVMVLVPCEGQLSPEVDLVSLTSMSSEEVGIR